MTSWPYSRSCRTASIRSGRAGGLAGELDCVVFDIGYVFIRWDPRNLYRRMGYPMRHRPRSLRRLASRRSVTAYSMPEDPWRNAAANSCLFLREQGTCLVLGS